MLVNNDNHLQKNIGKTAQVKKKKLHCDCLEQLPSLRLNTQDPRKLGNSGDRK